jgi:hypothetical protein
MDVYNLKLLQAQYTPGEWIATGPSINNLKYSK